MQFNRRPGVFGLQQILIIRSSTDTFHMRQAVAQCKKGPIAPPYIRIIVLGESRRAFKVRRKHIKDGSVIGSWLL